MGFVVSLLIPRNVRGSNSMELELEGVATIAIALKPGGRNGCLPLEAGFVEEQLGRLMPLPAGVPEDFLTSS